MKQESGKEIHNHKHAINTASTVHLFPMVKNRTKTTEKRSADKIVLLIG